MQRLAAFLAAGLVSFGGHADDIDSDVFGKGKWQPEEGENLPEWKEGNTFLPDYPQEKNLFPFEVDYAGPRYRYLLDVASLSIGRDKVVRYSVILESESGARNVYHEGIHCRKKKYKTYAIGTSDRTFRRMNAKEWKPWRRGGVFGYRPQLADRYLCNNLGYAYSEYEIMSRLRSVGTMDFDETGDSLAVPGFQ